jgi:hypothetical protein
MLPPALDEVAVVVIVGLALQDDTGVIVTIPLPD